MLRRKRAIARRNRARATSRRRRQVAVSPRPRLRSRRPVASLPPQVAQTYAGLAGHIKPVKAARVSLPVNNVASAPFDLSTPQTWSATTATTAGEMKFAVRAADGRHAGTAVLAPVALNEAAPEMVVPIRHKTLGGVPLGSLRRRVIERMVAEGGWVVNDMERVINGRRVFIVFAQSGAAGTTRQSWTFYFTEVDGRVYSLATNSLQEFAAPVATDSEKIVSSIKRKSDGIVAVN